MNKLLKSRPSAATRTCLNCHGAFASTGPFNRICSGCKGSEGWDGNGDYSMHVPSPAAVAASVECDRNF